MSDTKSFLSADLSALDPQVPIAKSTVERFEAFQAGGGGKVSREARKVDGLEVSRQDGVVVLKASDQPGLTEVAPGVLGLPENWLELQELTVTAETGGANNVQCTVLGARCRIMAELADGSTRIDLTDLPLAAGNEKLGDVFALRFEVPAGATVGLRECSLVPREGPLPALVDKFGQRRSIDFPGKVQTEDDLHRLREEEAASWESMKPPADRSRYGGWTGGPRFDGTGFFRTQQTEEGRWWLVDPEGYPFWSIGTTGVRIQMHNDSTRTRPPFPATTGRGDDTASPVRSREHLFEELPPTTGPEEQTWVEDDGVSFYTWNVLRKYGTIENWRKHVLNRFLHHGFNTFGNWSAEMMLQQDRIAHTRALNSRNDGSPMAYRRFPDVFSEAWEDWFDQHCARSVAPHRNNPWLLGYFVDNEGAWSNPRVLSAPPATATKQAWVSLLKDRYGADVAQLNTAWGTNFADWDAVARAGSDDLPEIEPRKEVEREFNGLFAEKYFGGINRILKKHDPNHLYLGCRFVKKPPDEAIIRAAGRHCDVLTVNCYSLVPERELFQTWHDQSGGRPILIGEHHLPLATPRQLPPLYQAFTPEERRQWYPAYDEAFAKMPFSVGSHWFQHSDQPLTGRYTDGENQPVGFVDITDHPHPELSEAARQLTARIYQLHEES